ncbi:hypothetical protein F4777DRAFT_565810 [Nemania sp. FL0916]|nr:hypothetical protein F4777DRAFT_565810 [Nemania sp. FL0916]
MPSPGRPSYGRRLMPAVLDELAVTTPHRLYGAITKTADVTEGFRDISVADMARCVNFMAQWIEKLHGRSGSFETISYIGIPDLRGPVIFLAAVKCGYKLLLPSPRNPPSTNASLMEQTGSTKLLHAAEMTPIVKQLSGVVSSLHMAPVPSFDEMIMSEPDPYLYNKSFNECRDDPIVVLHSSGSTGLPKPITMTHGSFAVLDNEHNLRDVPGRRKRDWSMWTFDSEARVYTVFPFFHLAGFASLTVQTIFMNASPVLGPPHLMPDTPLLKLVMQHQKLRSMFLPPAVIEGLLHEPNGIDAFKHLDFLVYSGAPFSPANGDRLSKVVEIISPFGSTEAYPQPELAPISPEDWAYHEFNPEVKHEMQLYDAAEGTYEFVILVDETTKDTAAAYHNLPGIAEYHTKDLFVRHPQKPQLFKYYGRRDDIIVLANGEKFNPTPLEINVQNHPSLKGAFVIGNGRRQASLLVEPKESLDKSGRQSLLEKLWPLIVSSNDLVPGQGRIQKSRVLCGLPEKPFKRTGKGTIVRKLTEENYKNEIEQLYLEASSSAQANLTDVHLRPTLSYDLPNVEAFCRGIVSAAFPPADKIGGDEDFVAHGLDSEHIVEIISNLKRHLRSQTQKPVDWISPRTLFRNSTMNSLSRVMLDFLNNGSIPDEDFKLARSRLMEEVVAEYTNALPDVQKTTRRQSQTQPPERSSTTVAIIGSTGYLGTHTAAAFLKDPKISRIFCLNRSIDAKAKQEASLSDLGIISRDKLDKLVFITVDLEKESLGLSREDREMILSSADVMVLNAWKSNFVLPLRYFRPFLNATREVIQLAAVSTASSGMHIVFISSLASVGAMARKTKVPETLVEDPLAAFNNGYAQSKLAAERILAVGSERCGVSVSVVRVTQIGGPIIPLLKSEGGHGEGGGGKWAEQGWIAAIARTAKAIGRIPADGPPVDWLPVDTIAELLRREVGREVDETKEIRFLNALHPQPLPWKLFVQVLQKSLGVDLTISIRSWTRDVRVLGRITNNDGSSTTILPALPLVEYYEQEFGSSVVPEYATSLAVGDFAAGDIPILDEEILRTWLSDWEL